MKQAKSLKQGFSLMEMMVVLLIVSIVAAASAPMISKKMVRSASGTSPWVWAGTKGGIAFNMSSNNEASATIGAINDSVNSSDKQSRLFINGNDEVPFITFKNDNNNLVFRFKNNGLVISDKDTTVNDNATVIGSQASGASDAVAVGAEAAASSANAIAIGSDVTASGIGSIGIGSPENANKTTASAENAIAIGRNAKATRANSITIGEGTSVTEDDSVIIGHLARSTKNSAANSMDGSVVIGNNARVGGNGANANASSIAIGRNANAGREGAVAIGHGAIVETEPNLYGQGQVSIGWNARANSNSGIAIGRSANATGSGRNIAIGAEAQTRETAGASTRYYHDSVSIGASATTRGDYSLALGGGASNSNKTVGYGSRTFTSGANSAYTQGDRTIAIGSGAYSLNADAIAIGTNAVSLIDGIAIGHGAEVTGTGNEEAAKGIAIGHNAKANHIDSVAIGRNAQTTAKNQIVLGTANDTVYIQGNLVVGKRSFLNTAAIYVNGTGSPGKNRWYWTEMCIDGTPSGSGVDDSDARFVDGPSQLNSVYSDRRLKNVGEAFKGGLEQIRKIEIFNYTFKKDPDKTPRVGVMAQDLQKIFPNAVTKGDDGFLRIRMEDMFYALVNAVKELDSKVTALSEQFKTNLDVVAKLKATVDSQNEEIKAQKAEIKALQKQNADFEKRLAKLESKKSE